MMLIEATTTSFARNRLIVMPLPAMCRTPAASTTVRALRQSLLKSCHPSQRPFHRALYTIKPMRTEPPNVSPGFADETFALFPCCPPQCTRLRQTIRRQFNHENDFSSLSLDEDKTSPAPAPQQCPAHTRSGRRKPDEPQKCPCKQSINRKSCRTGHKWRQHNRQKSFLRLLYSSCSHDARNIAAEADDQRYKGFTV